MINHHDHDHHWQLFQVLKIIIVNILLSLGDQISDFLQVFSFFPFGKQSALALLVDFNDQAFNLLFLTWWSDGQVPEWEEYWHEKYESPNYLFY